MQQKAVYLLNLYYSSIKAQGSLVSRAREIVAKVSGQDYQLVAYGEHLCTIGFASSATRAQLRADLRELQRDGEMSYLLVQASALTTYYMTKGGAEWLAKHLPTESVKDD